MPEYQNSKRVSVFLSMSDEIGTEDILRLVLKMLMESNYDPDSRLRRSVQYFYHSHLV